MLPNNVWMEVELEFQTGFHVWVVPQHGVFNPQASLDPRARAAPNPRPRRPSEAHREQLDALRPLGDRINRDVRPAISVTARRAWIDELRWISRVRHLDQRAGVLYPCDITRWRIGRAQLK